jgi:hypothetical protein
MGLTDNGSVLGYTHSGPVAFNGSNNGAVFVVISNLLLVPVVYEGSNVLFVAKVNGGGLQSGAVLVSQGGTPTGGDVLKVGALGSC